MTDREQLTRTRRWVVKIGSALLTANGRGLDKNAVRAWVEQMAAWCQGGRELVLVSSGAVAEGMTRLGWKQRPRALHELQAAAAVGQMGLVQTYESCFLRFGLHTAQVLLTHDDLSNRERYLNARSTLRTLLNYKVIPVINENDTVATEEIRFGDNDTLAALVANLIEADLLIILTDQQGLFDSDPRSAPDARLVEQGAVGDPSLEAMAGAGGGGLGRGGMITKLRAARLAARSGTPTVIASGWGENILTRIAAGESVGSLLLPERDRMAARKRWLAGQLQVRGRLVLDPGAVRVVRSMGSSLLAVGVRAVTGDFARGELVSCVDENGLEIARGLVNYDAAETRRIQGKSSREFEGILGYLDEEELIHRDNLVLT